MFLFVIKNITINGEFDPGSGWTLAACLTHASRTRPVKVAVADGWVTRKNLPFGGGYPRETGVNTP